MTITEIATYSGADREQLLYSGAKSEASSLGTHRSPANPTKAWSKPSKLNTPA